VKETQDAPHTENQAAAWLVRLDADSSAEAVKHWQDWLKEDVRRRAAFVRLEEGWRQMDCLRSLKPLDGAVNPNVLDTFPGVPAGARTRNHGVAATPGAPVRPKVPLGDLAIQTVAVALAAGMLAGKLVLCCWLFINLDGPR
jgi:ferric-dicitrate binding protein FerR (iron transport regulator)